MCGIAGVVQLDGAPVAPVPLHRMGDAIAHRGPDGEGSYANDAVGLAHRRLAIIDLSPAARQPMATEDGRFVIAYNGELYNFAELRVELEALGQQFRSRSDTEVVLKALAVWGESALVRFNGMFALALWDDRRRELLLARDRYGVKPLYYAAIGARVLFGSEIKAILAYGAHRADIDLEGLIEYFTFQNFFTERTLFRDVRLLPPGSFVKVSVPNRVVGAVRSYWDFSFEEPAEILPAVEYERELTRLLRQAVNRQLVADVDVGTYLSGGLDSGSVAALAAEQLPYIRSFTCGFDLNSASGVELAYDERPLAEYMSYLLRTEHYEMVLKAGDMERILPQLAWHLEEPRVGQCYPNFYTARLASKFVKVVLSGTGSDELFAGYPWRYYRAVVNTDFDHYVDKYFAFWQRLLPPDRIAAVFRPIWGKVKDVSTRDIFRSVFHHYAPQLTRPEDYVNHSLYFEAKTFLHGLLVVEDKLSMAHSLETRVPFLDNDLVDFAMRVPASMKLGNLTEIVRLNENEPGSKPMKYFQRTNDGKLILRNAVARLLPPEIVAREKQGFSAPDASWFKGQSIDYVRRVIGDRRSRIYHWLDFDAVNALVRDHLEGRENRRLLIWSLLNFEQWCLRFLP